jgi:hypothetical protein
MDGWWRDIGDDDDDNLLQIPIPAGCQNGVSGSESRFLMMAAQRNSIWGKCPTPNNFMSKGICRRKEGSRRRLGWPHHTLARPGLGHATRWCGGLPAPLHLVFWLRGSSGKIGFLQYFPGFFLKVGFLQKKQDTRAIMLKTALVRVSCIQNTQIWGETIAKVFRKVDTFWTYHGAASNSSRFGRSSTTTSATSASSKMRDGKGNSDKRFLTGTVRGGRSETLRGGAKLLRGMGYGQKNTWPTTRIKWPTRPVGVWSCGRTWRDRAN